MRKIVRSYAWIVAIVLLAGCSTSNVVNVAASVYPPVPLSRVQVLYKEPTRQYDVIALVTHEAQWIGSAQGEIRKLRELAARAGADAILITSAEGDTMVDYAKASAKAIRWK